MATSTPHTLSLHNGKSAQPLRQGQPNLVKAQAGEHYRVLRGADGHAQLATGVIARRHGDDLTLDYADGTRLTLQDYYVACKGAAACDITLPAQDGSHHVVADETGGAVPGDGSVLVYAYDGQDALMAMAKDDSAHDAAFGASGSAGATGSSDAAGPSSGSGLFVMGGVALAAAAIAAAGGGGGSHGGNGGSIGDAGSGGVPTGGNHAISGTVVAGPVLGSNDLTVNLYKGDGTTLLGTARVDASGHFSIAIQGYDGVVVARLGNSGAADYMDEATGQARNISADLMAVGVAEGSTLTMNINPLTTVAALQAGVVFNGAGSNVLTAGLVNQANNGVAAAFGLTDLLGGGIVTTVGTTGAANPDFTPAELSAAEKYGAVLAALSGVDAANGGNMQATINALNAGVSTSSTGGTLTSAVADAVVGGAVAAGARTDGTGAAMASLLNHILSQNNSKVAINDIAVDNVIGVGETGISITGTVTAGGTVSLLVGGASKAATVSGTTWSTILTPADLAAMGQGGETIVATASVGGSSYTARRSIWVDTTAPAATITDNVSGSANGPVTYTFSFSEPVAGFDGGDVAVSGGTKGAFTAVSPTQYTLVVTPTANASGNMSVSLAAGAAQDLLGNASVAVSAAAQAYDTRVVPVDTTAPAVTITDNVAGTANGPVTYSFTFSEPVTGFDAGDVTVTNGSKGAFTAVSATQYTLVVTPTANATGNVTVSLAADAARDGAGNGSTAALDASQAYDTRDLTPPVARVAAAALTSAGNAVVQSSEAGTAYLVDAALAVTNAASITGAADTRWNAVAITSANTDTSLSAAGLADGTYKVYTVDAAGNLSAPSTNSVTVDATAPTVAIADNTPGTANGPLTYTFTFSEAVTGFDAGDVTVTNGTKGMFTAVSATQYTLVVTPVANAAGNVTVSLAADAARDAAGNGSAAVSGAVQPYDTRGALLIDAIAVDDVIGITEQGATITGSNAAGSSVSLSIGGATRSATVSGITWSYTLGPADLAAMGQGSQTITATATLNGASVTASRSIQVDTVAPGVAITDDVAGTANGPVTYTFTFSEPVTGFDAGDLAVSGGTKGAFTAVSASQYTLVVAPTANASGNITVSLADNAAQDGAGNPSAAVSAASQAYDTAPPTAQVAAAALTSAGNAVVRSSEAGTAYLVDAALAVTEVAGITGAADHRWNSVAIATANADTNLSAAGLADGVYKVYTADAAGNLSAASSSSVVVDSTAPTVTITDNVPGTANGPLTYTFTFSEPVTGFDADDISVTNGAKGTFTAVSGTQYTLVVTPSSIGNITVSLANDAARDAAGNASTAALDASQVYDTSDLTAPVATVAPATFTGAGGNVLVRSSEPGNAYLVKSGFSIGSLADIAFLGDSNWNQATITAPDTDTSLSTDGLSNGSYALYTIDAAGNLSTASADRVTIDRPVASVVGVALTAASGARNGTLNAGDTVFVTATMSEATVLGSRGSDRQPQLALNIGGNKVYATYDSGSGTNALVFKYTIQAGQTDINGIGIDANALNLNGSTLLDADGNFAILSSTAVADNAGYKVDTTSPAASGVAITSSSARTPGYLVAGETVYATVSMTEAAVVDTARGTPQLALNVGGSTVYADYDSGSGTSALVFKYVIQPGQTDSDGIGIDASTLILNGGTLTDMAGNPAATLAVPAAGPNANYKVDTTAPAATGVAITSATGVQNGTLNAGDTIYFTVNMSEATTVNATGSKPQLALNIGGGTVYADYDSGSGSSALVFKYTIQPGQRDSDGISIDNGAQLNLNGGSLVDAAGNAAAPALPALPANAGYKVDAVVPAVTAVGITSSNAAEPGNLVTGETVHISVTMSEATTVDTTGGTPQLALNIGGASVQAVYESGSGSTALVFKYVIQPGQTDLDGIGIDANALSLNGATLTDAAGNMASLAAPGAADNVAYKVNAVTSPTVVSAAITSATGNQDGFLSAGDTVSVTVTTNRPAFVTGTPQLDLDIGGRIVHATYASGSGGTALVFSYTIEDGEQDADGIAIVGNSLALNGGTILTGTNGAIALGHSGAPDNAGYVVDAAAPAVSGVAIGSATGIQNGVLSAGDVVSVIVSMSEATTVSTAGGVPQLDLDIGGDIVHAAYDSGSGSNALVFKYTIQPGQTDANGIAVVGNSLALNGGTMRDLAGNAASLAHAAATDSPGYVVEAVAPTLTSSTPAANATAVSANGSLVLNFSEAMSIGSGNIVISDSDGSSITIAASDASQVSVNGSTVTIRPSAPLKVYTTYTVAVEAGAFADAAGNPYAGLAGQSFTTASSVMNLASVGSLGTGIQVAGFTVIGESASDMSGYSVAAAGDVNGDGLADMIIGAPNYDTGGVSDTGRAYVVFGTASTAPISLANIASGKGGFVINGGTVAGSASTTVGIQAGYSVSAAGDLNGDGLADLLVGTPQHVGSNPTNYGRGKVFIVYGKSDTATVQLTSLGSAGIAINGGGAAGANYGASVAAVGDVNGDGMVDVAFGAPHDAPYNRTDTGSVYAYVGGSTTANTMSLSSVSTSYQNYAGAVAGDLTGSSVAAAGDFNGDGLADMIFGAGKGGDTTATDAGISYLVFGRSSPWGATNGNNGTDLSSKTSTLFLTITGESALDNAGMSAVGVGDVNGDGLADLLIGAPGADAGARTDAGRSYVVFGTTSTAAIKLSSVAAGTGGFVINGESAGDASGYKVAAAGDLNGDGLADMLISANKADTTGGADAGRTYVVYGTTSTAPIELSAIAAGRGGFVIDGAGASDQSGTSVVAGGDINGDGLGDLIVSATQADANGVADVGVTYVIFGSTGGAFQASTVDQAADGSHATITGSAASETLVGDAGANTLVGNGGADVIHAGAGNDTIVLNAGNVAALQATYGSGGNATQLARVDGGGGIDTLKLDGSGINLDLSAIRDVGLVGGINMSRLSSIEKIDLTGSGNNSLKLTMADVVDIAGFNSFNTSNSSGWTSTVLGAVEGRHQLLIDGDAGDSVAISGAGWTDAGTATYNGHTYEVYRNGAYTELLIDTSVTRTLV